MKRPYIINVARLILLSQRRNILLTIFTGIPLYVRVIRSQNSRWLLAVSSAKKAYSYG